MHCGFGGVYLSRSQVIDRGMDRDYNILDGIQCFLPLPSENFPQLF